jgi:hypothetical protein
MYNYLNIHEDWSKSAGKPTGSSEVTFQYEHHCTYFTVPSVSGLVSCRHFDIPREERGNVLLESPAMKFFVNLYIKQEKSLKKSVSSLLL